MCTGSRFDKFVLQGDGKMYKDLNFVLSFSLATIVLLGIVFLEVVDPLSVAIVSGIIVLAFGLYNFLVRKEFFKLRKEICSLMEENVKSLNKSDNASIKIIIPALLERYKETVENYCTGKVDSGHSLAELRSIKLELVKVLELHCVLTLFFKEVTAYGEIIKRNDYLNNTDDIHKYLNKMFQCYEVADKIISKMDKRRLSIIPNLQDIFYRNRSAIRILIFG